MKHDFLIIVLQIVGVVLAVGLLSLIVVDPLLGYKVTGLLP